MLACIMLSGSTIGPWWGANPTKHEQDDIDVLAANREQKLLIIGECRCQESLDETAEINDLDSRRDLVRGYHASYLYPFSKHPVSDTVKILAHFPTVRRPAPVRPSFQQRHVQWWREPRAPSATHLNLGVTSMKSELPSGKAPIHVASQT